MDNSKRRALGRGLDALLPATPAPTPQAAPVAPAASATSPKSPAAPTAKAAPLNASVARIEELHPNRLQPRTRFDDEALTELSESLKQLGMLEPILVRKRAGGGFEIVAGERRWRAAQRAGLHEVPIFVRELSDAKVFEAALVENLQREDLNPIETAQAFQRLLDDHGHSQESLAQLIGKDRSTIANALRLMKLPESVLELVSGKSLSEGHGRALLSASDPKLIVALSKQAVSNEWSVRETERQARAAVAASKTAPKAKAPNNANLKDLEERLTRSVGARVTVSDRKGKGKLHITFASYDELDRIIELLGAAR